MIVVDLMTRNVVTVTRETPIIDALKIMNERGFRRLPVVDEDGHPVGMISLRDIEELKPHAGLPGIWQMGSWASKHTVGEMPIKKPVTVKPSDTVEFATTKAQSLRVGSLLVVDEGKVCGIVTTNDIFYRVVNPTLGIGEKGSRVVVVGGGTGAHAAIILDAINKLGIDIRVIWAIFSPTNLKSNLVVHLDTDDPRNVIVELTQLGYEARTVNR